MSNGDSKPEPAESDPAKLAQLLEIELMQKRAAWQQAKARRGNLRAISFFFLFIVIVGSLVAFFVFFSGGRVSELHPNGGAPSPSPLASPE